MAGSNGQLLQSTGLVPGQAAGDGGDLAALFVGGLLFVPVIGAEFIPAMDQGMINVTVELPLGSRMEETDKVVRKVEEAFQRYENDIELLFPASAAAIRKRWEWAGSNSGSIYIGLVPLEERTHSTQEIIEFYARLSPSLEQR